MIKYRGKQLGFMLSSKEKGNDHQNDKDRKTDHVITLNISARKSEIA